MFVKLLASIKDKDVACFNELWQKNLEQHEVLLKGKRSVNRTRLVKQP